MKCLGIESTAHTFSASVVDEKLNILSNVKDSYTTKSGGMIPRELSEHHYKVANEIVKEALEEANVKIKDINLIAFSKGPGIGNTLKCGAQTARQLSLLNNIDLVGVNHCVAHLEIGKATTDAVDPVLLYASGANTQIICYENGYYRVFGETLDTGIGNFLDTFGRKIGLGFPAGPKLDKIYFKGKKLIDLPYTVKGMDLSFSGLLTSAENKYKKLISEGKTFESQEVSDLIYSTLHYAFAMLSEVTERALAHTGKKEVVLGGGVGCSKALQEMVRKMCEQRGAKLFVPKNELMVDNAAMIAVTGIITKDKNKISVNKSEILPKWRTDEVKVNWL
jgi:N6-L-threonylcarbamoyladenine synthase